ncbi:hypothetical protein [Pseudomonas purpurea]|uniref:hypothetical protein n=1 Tax=Pseudomonas purpurea TaxID=3136737 RepID=UPI003265ABE5
MKHIAALCFLLFCTSASSEVLESNLDCKPGAEGGLILSSAERVFVIKSPERDCQSAFTFKTYPGKTGAILIFAWPPSDEFGLNSQRYVYSVMPEKKEATHIGYIPAGADEIEDRVFKHVLQEGGSIYETRYRIESDKVSTLSPVKELIIADTLCIYPQRNSSKCEQMTGTFENLVCVMNYGERKVLADISACAGMIDQ